MSLYDYRASQRIAAEDPPFYALIMAAMRKADTANTAKLMEAWPEVWDELKVRYGAPGGVVPEDGAAYIDAALSDDDRRQREQRVYDLQYHS